MAGYPALIRWRHTRAIWPSLTGCLTFSGVWVAGGCWGLGLGLGLGIQVLNDYSTIVLCWCGNNNRSRFDNLHDNVDGGHDKIRQSDDSKIHVNVFPSRCVESIVKQEVNDGGGGVGGGATAAAITAAEGAADLAAATIVKPNAEPNAPLPLPLPASRKTAILFSRSSALGEFDTDDVCIGWVTADLKVRRVRCYIKPIFSKLPHI